MRGGSNRTQVPSGTDADQHHDARSVELVPRGKPAHHLSAAAVLLEEKEGPPLVATPSKRISSPVRTMSCAIMH